MIETNLVINSYLCNELQNERLFCTRHDTCRVEKNSHFATSFIQDFF
jgi:hypothetical protein